MRAPRLSFGLQPWEVHVRSCVAPGAEMQNPLVALSQDRRRRTPSQGSEGEKSATGHRFTVGWTASGGRGGALGRRTGLCEVGLASADRRMSVDSRLPFERPSRPRTDTSHSTPQSEPYLTRTMTIQR